MARGGARIGAGRKPKRPLAFPVVDGGVSSSESGTVSAVPPDDLPADQRLFWQRYASLAIEKRTLTPHTVPAFRLLCELEAEKEQVRATIDKDGRTYIKVTVDGAGTEHEELKAHPLKADYAKLAKAVEGLMGRFTLAPFGKPVGVSSRTPAEAKKAAVRASFFGGARA